MRAIGRTTTRAQQPRIGLSAGVLESPFMLLVAWRWYFFAALGGPMTVGLVDAFAVAKPFSVYAITRRSHTHKLGSTVSREDVRRPSSTTDSSLPWPEDHRPDSFEWWKPPPWLEVLQVGEWWHPFPDDRPDCHVIKICSDPCLLHVRHLGCPSLEFLQSLQLTETASTRAATFESSSTLSSPLQSLQHRSGAAVGWIRTDDNNDDDEASNPTTTAVADYLTQLTQALFVTSNNNDDDDNAWDAEPLQVVHYNASGYYHLHHDGFQRAVTVLQYWNGVAGTWFPYAGGENAAPDQGWDWHGDPSQLVEGLEPGRDGVVFVGHEAGDDFTSTATEPMNSTTTTTAAGRSPVVRIQAGDAVVFYNYCQYDDDEGECPQVGMNWKSLHAALPAHHHEKWIATNWFRFCGDKRHAVAMTPDLLSTNSNSKR